MSIPIGTKMLTKPPKQKCKTHIKNHTFKKKRTCTKHKTLLNSTMNNDLCISQTYSNDNVKTSRLHDTHIVMNKGEINTGESSENENVHKFRKIAVLRLNLYLFEWFVIIECERTDKYTNLFTKKLSTRNSLNYIHNDR